MPGYLEKNLPAGKNNDYTVSAGASGRSCGVRPAPATGGNLPDGWRGGLAARQGFAPAAAGAAAPAGGTSVTKPIRVRPAACAAPITCAITS